jgi:hypothetical protein
MEIFNNEGLGPGVTVEVVLKAMNCAPERLRVTIKGMVWSGTEFGLRVYNEDTFQDQVIDPSVVALVQPAEPGHPLLLAVVRNCADLFLTSDDFGTDEEFDRYTANTKALMQAAFLAGKESAQP